MVMCTIFFPWIGFTGGGGELFPPPLQRASTPSLSPPHPHTMTQLTSLSWLAIMPKISRENRSLGGCKVATQPPYPLVCFGQQ